MVEVKVKRGEDGTATATVLYGSERPQTVSIPPSFLVLRDSWIFFDLLLPYAKRSVRGATVIGCLHHLRRLAERIRTLKIVNIPRDKIEWQNLIDRVYNLEISDANNGCSLETRILIWNNFFLKYFKYIRSTTRRIPGDVKIPVAKEFANSNIFTQTQPTLIDGAIKKIISAETLTNPDKELLISLKLSRTDVAYLDELRDELVNARAALEGACYTYAVSMRSHFDYGCKLLSLVSKDEVQMLMEKYKNYNDMRRGELGETGHPGTTEISLARILRLFQTIANEKKISQIFNESSWLPSWQWFQFPDSTPEPTPTNNQMFTRFSWMMGYLQPKDLTPLHALLMLHSPNFSPDALKSADIVKDEKSRFEISLAGVTFTIDKPRARAEKTSQLSATSAYVYKLLRDMTADARKEISTSNKKLSSRLFLLRDHRGLSAPNRCAFYQDITKKLENGTISFPAYPQLDGVLTTKFNASKIRHTEIVLEWFRTGSIASASRKGGNTTQVVIGNYIPASLLVLWNTRLIRRFQNLLIVLRGGAACSDRVPRF